MKYIKLFESMNEKEVEVICRKYDIRNWTLKDGLVDVDGDIDLISKGLTKLPLQFGRVTGHFYCHQNKLTTLEGAPKRVGGHFYCFYNKLTTLEGGPTEVGGDFSCQFNKLTTLENGPKEVGGNFVCNDNFLTTLEGAPTEVGGDFYCYINYLTTLEGGPQEVGGKFYCQFTHLNTLKWAPEYVGDEVIFLPNKKLPTEFLNFLQLNDNREDLQTYILKWQKDYAVWKKDGSFNKANFIQMMEVAQDELKILKFPE